MQTDIPVEAERIVLGADGDAWIRFQGGFARLRGKDADGTIFNITMDSNSGRSMDFAALPDVSGETFKMVPTIYGVDTIPLHWNRYGCSPLPEPGRMGAGGGGPRVWIPQPRYESTYDRGLERQQHHHPATGAKRSGFGLYDEATVRAS